MLYFGSLDVNISDSSCTIPQRPCTLVKVERENLFKSVRREKKFSQNSVDISDCRLFSSGSLFKCRQLSDFVVEVRKICLLKNKVILESLGISTQTSNLKGLFEVSCIEFEAALTQVTLNLLHPKISMHILRTALYTFPELSTRIIYLSIKSFFSW